MDGANRKIELQSPEDLTYLINNVRRAATEHINAAFPPVDDDHEEDELRMRIEKIVDEYISQTFTMSAPNLSINGFDLDATTFPAVYLADPSSAAFNNSNNKKKTRSSKNKQPEPEIVQYEPFDARKRARVEELARQEEDLMREIAALKRRLPGAAAKGYTEGFWDGVSKDEAAITAARERALQTISGCDGGNKDGQDDTAAAAAAAAAAATEKKNRKKRLLEGVDSLLERQNEVEGTYAGVVDTLGRLKREMPATVAKMERARVAAEYVVTER